MSNQFLLFLAEAIKTGMGDTFAAVHTRQIYSQRQLSDNFHKFAETCLGRSPDDRPTVAQLLHHHFFKQAKHTTLQEKFQEMMEFVDLEKISDENVEGELLSEQMGGITIDGQFEWDFS
jgi:hypothetical protein